jgi:hypothetical protein
MTGETTMVDDLILTSSCGTIRATLSNTVPGQKPIYWLQCYLLQETEAFLGANDADYIGVHLLRWLQGATYRESVWILSLAEEHNTFYGEHHEDHSTILIQDKNGAFVYELALTASERADWIERIKVFIQTLSTNPDQ